MRGVDSPCVFSQTRDAVFRPANRIRQNLNPRRVFSDSTRGGDHFAEPTHYGVQVSEAEKRLVAAWIDLCVPFCGSYTEANQWNDEQKKTYRYFEEKRLKLAAEEVEALKKNQSATEK